MAAQVEPVHGMGQAIVAPHLVKSVSIERASVGSRMSVRQRRQISISFELARMSGTLSNLQAEWDQVSTAQRPSSHVHNRRLSSAGVRLGSMSSKGDVTKHIQSPATATTATGAAGKKLGKEDSEKKNLAKLALTGVIEMDNEGFCTPSPQKPLAQAKEWAKEQPLSPLSPPAAKAVPAGGPPSTSPKPPGVTPSTSPKPPGGTPSTSPKPPGGTPSTSAPSPHAPTDATSPHSSASLQRETSGKVAEAGPHADVSAAVPTGLPSSSKSQPAQSPKPVQSPQPAQSPQPPQPPQSPESPQPAQLPQSPKPAQPFKLAQPTAPTAAAAAAAAAAAPSHPAKIKAVHQNQITPLPTQPATAMASSSPKTAAPATHATPNIVTDRPKACPRSASVSRLPRPPRDITTDPKPQRLPRSVSASRLPLPPAAPKLLSKAMCSGHEEAGPPQGRPPVHTQGPAPAINSHPLPPQTHGRLPAPPPPSSQPKLSRVPEPAALPSPNLTAPAAAAAAAAAAAPTLTAATAAKPRFITPSRIPAPAESDAASTVQAHPASGSPTRPRFVTPSRIPRMYVPPAHPVTLLISTSPRLPAHEHTPPPPLTSPVALRQPASLSPTSLTLPPPLALKPEGRSPKDSLSAPVTATELRKRPNGPPSPVHPKLSHTDTSAVNATRASQEGTLAAAAMVPASTNGPPPAAAAAAAAQGAKPRNPAFMSKLNALRRPLPIDPSKLTPEASSFAHPQAAPHLGAHSKLEQLDANPKPLMKRSSLPEVDHAQPLPKRAAALAALRGKAKVRGVSATAHKPAAATTATDDHLPVKGGGAIPMVLGKEGGRQHDFYFDDFPEDLPRGPITQGAHNVRASMPKSSHPQPGLMQGMVVPEGKGPPPLMSQQASNSRWPSAPPPPRDQGYPGGMQAAGHGGLFSPPSQMDVGQVEGLPGRLKAAPHPHPHPRMSDSGVGQGYGAGPSALSQSHQHPLLPPMEPERYRMPGGPWPTPQHVQSSYKAAPWAGQPPAQQMYGQAGGPQYMMPNAQSRAGPSSWGMAQNEGYAPGGVSNYGQQRNDYGYIASSALPGDPTHAPPPPLYSWGKAQPHAPNQHAPWQAQAHSQDAWSHRPANMYQHSSASQLPLTVPVQPQNAQAKRRAARASTGFEGLSLAEVLGQKMVAPTGPRNKDNNPLLATAI